MKNSFSNLVGNEPNLFSRKFGGTIAGVADPYVSGYAFVWFDRIPDQLSNFTSSTNEEVKQLLAASCLSVTNPGGTLNKIDFTGLGGIRWAVPGNIDYENTFSVKFLEFSGAPILDIFHGWVKMIRDYRLGTSEMTAGTYSKTNYSGTVYYWTTAPDGVTVEYYACYDGVFPTRDPQNLYNFDVENVSKLEVEIEFNVDYVWHEDWVKDRCQSFADNTFKKTKDYIKNYGTKN